MPTLRRLQRALHEHIQARQGRRQGAKHVTDVARGGRIANGDGLGGHGGAAAARTNDD